ncbi:MAG: hypothetical protein IIZ78_08615 [Clostridiales bacterium]|nr:hypothetical protein [Clostridiales bacterium]
MIRPLISILTLYQIDQTLFDNMELPARPFTDRGYEDLFLTGWDLNKDTLVENLLMELAELNVLYTDPVFMKYAITTWSKKNKAVWQALYETLFFKYNPIWNKDGTLKHTAEETRNLANGLTISGTGSGTVNETTGNTRVTDADEVTQRNEVSRRTITEGMDGSVTETETPGVQDTAQTTYNTNEERDYLTTHGGTVVTDKTASGSQNELSEDNWTENTTTQVSAFDANTWQNREKSDTTHAGTGEKNIIHSDTGKETVTDTSTVADTGDLAKTGTETLVTSHSGENQKVTDYDTTKTTQDNLTEHGDDTSRELDETVTDSGTRSQTTSSTDSRTQSGTDTGTVETEFTDQEYGNIGVTMTQQLIEAERNLVRFNIYDLIIDDFKQRFCVLIY